MTDHVSQMVDLGIHIVATKETLPDIHITRALVLSLPQTPQWDVIKIQLFNVNVDKFTSKLVSATLIAKVNHWNREQESETALLTTQQASSNAHLSTKKKQPKRMPKPEDECHYCHAKGHWVSQCPKCQDDERNKSGWTVNLAVSGLQELLSREIGVVLMTTMGLGCTELILDCGAMSHMFCDHRYFVSHTPSIGSETI
ncbi:hypothetical protein K439DRAFT_1615555 [Ramaria rubella]|nr:hypothetical protein K439DRAFT_1615555 [Ramaria rubella]